MKKCVVCGTAEAIASCDVFLDSTFLGDGDNLEVSGTHTMAVDAPLCRPCFERLKNLVKSGVRAESASSQAGQERGSE